MKVLFSLIALAITMNLAAANELLMTNESVFEPSFTNRFSLQATANPSPRQLSSITNFSASYALKRSTYWLDFTAQNASGYFNKMTANNPATTGLTDDQLYNVNSTHSSFGIGMMLESRYAQTLLPGDELFEITSAYLTYNLFKVSSLSDSYTGPGITTKFSLCKKYSNFFSLGANLNYSLAVVKGAEKVAGESSSARSLTLSYLTMGLDFIFTL